MKKFKMIVVKNILLVSIIPLIFAGLFIYWQGSKYIREQIYNQMSTISESIIDKTSMFMKERISNIESWASNEHLKNLALINSASQKDNISNYLGTLNQTYLDFHCILVFDSQGFLIGSSKPDHLNNAWIIDSYHNEDWYKKMFNYFNENDGKIYIDEAVLSSFTSDYYSYATLVAKPIMSGKKRVAYIMGLVNWGFLYSIIDSLEIGQEKQSINAFVNIIDQDGRVLVAPEFQRRVRVKEIGSIYSNGFKNYRNLIDNLNPAETIHGETKIDQKSYVFSAAKANTIIYPQHFEWTAIVSKNTAQALHPIRSLAVFISIIVISFIFICVLVSTKLSDYISRPISHLSVLMQEFYKKKNDFADHSIKYDVTSVEIKQLFDSFMQMAKDIKNYQSEIEKSAHLAAIGQSTAMVAHDVRRPLTSMMALLSILPSIKDDPAQLEKMTANVDQTITRTNAMLNEIMDFSRDATALELKECSPKVIFASSVSEALRNHPEADVEITYELDSEHVFHCDVARVTRVFANLIDNALGAMAGKGRGRLRILTHDETKEDKRFIITEVRDSGGGIPEEYLLKIFDPFFTKGKKGGTGLGLAICQKIASMHGGEIKAWNIPTIGAVFSVKIPAGTTREVVEDDEQDDLIHDSKELKVFREEESKRSVSGDTVNTAEFIRINKERGRISTLLVVDDEPLFRETIRSMLNTIGQVKDYVKVIEADSAEKALDIFETCKFDYVIADIDLGRNKMNGYKLTQEILEKYPSTYMLIHSNRRRDEMDEKIRVVASDHFLGFLPKPMKTDELLQFLACKSFETTKQVERSADMRTVLLLNDDTEFCFSMKCQLKSSTAQVLDVNNISDALKHISQNKVDAIISDINLGEGEPDGYEFLKHVREKDTQVPFYFMSGYNKSSEWPKAEKLGATGYFQLPFCIEDARKELEL